MCVQLVGEIESRLCQALVKNDASDGDNNGAAPPPLHKIPKESVCRAPAGATLVAIRLLAVLKLNYY